MRVNRTYSIPHETIIDLNNTISAKFRSKFVSKAIRNRLDGMMAYDVDDFSTLDLIIELIYRKDIPDWFKNQLFLVRKEMEE